MTLFDKAVHAIDDYNKKDPFQEIVDGESFPREYLYSLRHSNWLAIIAPEASEQLQLAVRSQHIGRWEIPRNSYPLTRSGYLTWRSDLAKHHASKTKEILEQVGYGSEFTTRVNTLNLKKNIKLDLESQILEDVLCLAFLEYQITDFASKHDKVKLLTIIQKTWKKMGERGKKYALTINYAPHILQLIKEALSL